jgi:hypothetical protein
MCGIARWHARRRLAAGKAVHSRLQDCEITSWAAAPPRGRAATRRLVFAADRRRVRAGTSECAQSAFRDLAWPAVLSAPSAVRRARGHGRSLGRRAVGTTYWPPGLAAGSPRGLSACAGARESSHSSFAGGLVRPSLLLGDAGNAESGVCLVASIDGQEIRGQRLDLAAIPQPTGVDASRSRDAGC